MELLEGTLDMVRRQPTRAANQRQIAQDKKNEQAWRAVQEFGKMKGSLTSFARTMTGNPKVQVKGIHGVSNTDGRNQIEVSIPIELGDATKHDRTYCNKRGDNFRQLCKACDIRELTLRNLYHEIGHIVGDSIAFPDKAGRNAAYRLVREFHPECEHRSPMEMNVAAAKHYPALTHSINEFMFIIWDSIEDARTDSNMINARPGLKGIFRAGVRAGLDRGIRDPEFPDEYLPFSYAPPNSQAIMYCYLRATGHAGPEEYISAEMMERLDNPVLNSLLVQAVDSYDAHETFDLATKVFVKLYELGFVQVERCIPQQPEPEQNDPDQEQNDTPDIPSLDKEQDPNGSPQSEHAGTPDGDPSQASSDDASSAADSPADPDSGTEPGAAADPGERGSGDDAGSAGRSDAADADADPEGDGDESESQAGGDGDGEQDGAPNTEQSEGAVPDGAQPEGASRGSDPSDHKPGNLDDDELGDAEAGGAENDQREGSRAGDGGEDAADSEAGGGSPGAAGDGAAQDGNGDGDGEPAPSGPQSGERDGHAGDPDAGQGVSGPEDSDEDGEAVGQREDGGPAAGDEPSSADEGADGGHPGDQGSDVWDGNTPIPQPRSPISDDGSASSAGIIFRELTGHSKEHEDDAFDQELDYVSGEADTSFGGSVVEPESQVIERAIGQIASFDTSSRELHGLQIQQFPNSVFRWIDQGASPENMTPPSSIIGPALMEARLAFSANKRTRHEKNLRSGKIDSMALGRRAAMGDDRLFHRKTIPAKRSYAVIIGIDVSGSTRADNRIERIKRAVFAQAEILDRLGVDFAIYAHTGGPDIASFKGSWDYSKEFVWELEVKSFKSAWNKDAKVKLANLLPLYNNFDGHSLEFYRKQVDKEQATDKVILYYTDGAMPAANYDEELEVLKREIDTCRRRNIALMAVGINTDSPKEYGFDTVEVNSDDDLKKVVQQLKLKLTR